MYMGNGHRTCGRKLYLWLSLSAISDSRKSQLAIGSSPHCSANQPLPTTLSSTSSCSEDSERTPGGSWKGIILNHCKDSSYDTTCRLKLVSRPKVGIQKRCRFKSEQNLAMRRQGSVHPISIDKPEDQSTCKIVSHCLQERDTIGGLLQDILSAQDTSSTQLESPSPRLTTIN